MNNPLKGKDILATSDWAKEELDQVLEMAYKLKRMGTASRSLDILKGKSLELLFFAASTRTRTSFTAAMHQLGGFVQIPEPGDLRLSLEDKPGTGESIKDTALVFERYVDALGIRVATPISDENGAPRPGGGHLILQKFADYTKMPVLNMGDGLHHPTQAVADLMVMQENLGDVRNKKIVVMWTYTPLWYQRTQSSVLSTGLIASTYGMDITYVYPEGEGYELYSSVMPLIEKECNKGGAKFKASHDPKKALEGADVVYPRNWYRYDWFEHTREEGLRRAMKYKDWRMTDSLLKLTNNARVIHCMPFDRGYEADDSVWDGPNSVVYDEAENLLHVRKAFLALLMADGDALKRI